MEITHIQTDPITGLTGGTLAYTYPGAGVSWVTPTPSDIALAEQKLAFRASEDGELLKFENAVLCRAERNKNGDAVDEQGLQEIAGSLPLMALDDEHIEDKVVGFFTAARVQDRAVYCDGVIYARRFPEEAQAARSGKKRLSVEAFASLARCSECQQEFRAAEPYCDHMRDRFQGGATRHLYGLKAAGGGLTSHPAGTDTDFDVRNGFRMIASLTDPATEASTENVAPPTPETAEETNMPTIEELEAVQATLAEVQAVLLQREADLEMKATETATLTARVAELETQVAGLEISARRGIELAASGFTADEIEAIMPDLATASDRMFDLLRTKRAAAVTTAEPEVPPAEEPRMEAAHASSVLGDADPLPVDVTGWDSIFA